MTDGVRRVPLSGVPHVLRAGGYEAVIAGVGASLRSLTFEGRDLIVPFAAEEVRPANRGVTLAPWPNRVVDGRYTFDGTDYRLALTEPARGHALHGLLVWTPYAAVTGGPRQVTLGAVIEAQAGYPWRLVVETTFTLTESGLTQSVRARNEGDTPAPWGTGPHPYLVAASGALEEWTLRLPASEVLGVTPDRLSPTVLAPVDSDAPRFDFRSPHPIADAAIDHAFTALERDAEGWTSVEVTDDAGHGVAMTWDAACPWVQIHTADQPDPASPMHRVGLAVEPMTCAPDAFNDANYPHDTGLLVIPPGEWSPVASWTLHAL